MKISGTGSIGNVKQAKKAGSSSSVGFSKFLDEASEADEAKPASGIKPLTSVNFIQEVNPDGQKKRALVNKGNEILDKLEEIRDSLLFGNISINRLQNLQKIIDGVESGNDNPELADIIEQIKTRAAVELAKMGL